MQLYFRKIIFFGFWIDFWNNKTSKSWNGQVKNKRHADRC